MKPMDAVLSAFDVLKALSDEELKELLTKIRAEGTDHDDGMFADTAAESMVEAFIITREIYNDEGRAND